VLQQDGVFVFGHAIVLLLVLTPKLLQHRPGSSR
jgi:hypothetical protein